MGCGKVQWCVTWCVGMPGLVDRVECLLDLLTKWACREYLLSGRVFEALSHVTMN